MDVTSLQFPLPAVWKLVEHALSCPQHFWDEEMELEDTEPALLLRNYPSFHLTSNGYPEAATSPASDHEKPESIPTDGTATVTTGGLAPGRPAPVFAVGFDPTQDETVMERVEEICEGESWTEQLLLTAEWVQKLQEAVATQKHFLVMDFEEGLTGDWTVL